MIEESSILFEADKAFAALKRGQVILYPTDTIWGLGCAPDNKSAVERIFEIKKRPRNKSLVLLVESVEMLKRYVAIHPRIETLLVVHKQPLTLIYNTVRDLPDHLLSENKSIAIRICKDKFCKELIRRLDKPLISTSANFSGQPYPKSFEDIDPELMALADYIVHLSEYKQKQGEPSVVATFNKKGELDFIRT